MAIYCGRHNTNVQPPERIHDCRIQQDLMASLCSVVIESELSDLTEARRISPPCSSPDLLMRFRCHYCPLTYNSPSCFIRHSNPVVHLWSLADWWSSPMLTPTEVIGINSHLSGTISPNLIYDLRQKFMEALSSDCLICSRPLLIRDDDVFPF
jgi:hypothetical protein